MTVAFHADGLEDMGQAYERSYVSGAVIRKPVNQLGVGSLRFLDPDCNLIHIHCIPLYHREGKR